MSKLIIIVSDNPDIRTSKAAELYGQDRESTRITTILADARSFLDEDKNVIMVASRDEAPGLEEMATVHLGSTEHEIVLRDLDA